MNETQLQSCTRRELLALAAKRGVRGRHRMSKDQLIAAIRPKRGRRAQPKVESPKSKVAVQNLRAGRRQRGKALQELTELPSSYGQTRLTLMGIDPFWVHAYWEVTPRDREAVMARLSPERVSAHWALRFYDVTYIDFDGTNAHSSFDQPVDLAAGNWYVNLWSCEKTYCADIGARTSTGRFEPACRSNFVHTPRADESPHYRPEWLHVEGMFDKVAPVAVPAPIESPGTAAEFQVPAETTPLAVPEHERPSHAPVADADIRKHYSEPPPSARAAGEQTVSARGDASGAAAEIRAGAAWHEVRGQRPSPPLGSSGSGSWAPSSQPAVDPKSSAEVGSFSQSRVRPITPVRK